MNSFDPFKPTHRSIARWFFAGLAVLIMTDAVGVSHAAETTVASPSWPADSTHRLLIRVDPIDNGNRAKEGMVASLHVDFAQYCKQPVDLSSLLVRQYDPQAGVIIDAHNNAFARVPGDLPMRFYDDAIPYNFPKYQGYVDHETGTVPELVNLPIWGRLFNTLGEGKSGQIAWAYLQKGHEPSYFEISFRELAPGASRRMAPAGFIGDGINRCLPEGGDFGAFIHGHLAVGDLGGTGLTDLVIGNAAGTLLWYRNRGTAESPKYEDAEFLRTEDGKPLDVGWSAAPELVDWDRDGLLDLIIGAEKEAVFFYKNVGDRHHPVFRNMGLLKLADGTELRVPHRPCDNDPENKIFATDYEPTPHVVDWKGNGKLDLMLGGYITGRIFYYENVADSPNDPPKLVYRGPLQADGKDIDVQWCAAPCTGDFRRNGKLDLITGSLPITPGGGDSSDPAKFLVYYENVGTRENPVLHHIEPFPAKGEFCFGSLASPRVADLHHNGLLDVVASISGNVMIIPNIGTPTQPLFDATVRPLSNVWGNADLPFEPTFIDYTGAGHQDMFVMDHIALNSGRGSPGIYDKTIPLPGAEKISHPIPRGDPWDTRVFADADGDGKPDVLVSDNDGYIWFHRNIGTKESPAFDPKGVRLKVKSGEYVKAGIPPANADAFAILQGARCEFAALHIDHTDMADLALADTYGKIRLFMHDPSVKPGETPRFLAPIMLPEPEPRERLCVCRVDWNHDGWDDLLYGYGSNDYYVLLNQPGPNGSRRLGEPQKLNVPHDCFEPFPSVVDWNNDGDSDLFVHQYSYTRLYLQSFIEHGYIPGTILTAEQR
jgi:hypothetical protein